VTPLYPQKLALTSPTGGGRSVGIVRSRTKATEYIHFLHNNLSVTNFLLHKLSYGFQYFIDVQTHGSVGQNVLFSKYLQSVWVSRSSW